MTEAFIAVSPGHRLDPALAVSACKAGALGILDLGYDQDPDLRRKAIRGLARHAAHGPGRWGLRWDMPLNPGLDPRELLGDVSEAVPVLVLSALDYGEEALGPLVEGFRGLAGEVFLEVHSGPEALAAQSAGCDGLILKGNEAGGRVGSESSFILLQRVRGLLTRPYWIQGGIGPDTAAAALVAGATGVVLCEQLWLTAESPLTDEDRTTTSRLDGSETTLLMGGGHEFRVFNSPAHLPLLQEYERSGPNQGGSWDRLVEVLTIENGPMSVFPLGQEVAFARGLADRHVTAGGVITAFRRRIAEDLAHAAQAKSLAPGSPMALDHGTRYPVLQGPMTRVSDVTPFCVSVAENGGLPFLSLSLMRGPEVRALLKETQERMGDHPWGVGILGFVPPELREEQIAEVCGIRPGFAIIAGGRPSQAHRLEELGIHTYLHVPSPGLLRTFYEAGSRRFILEGRECGGHVGPRSSFTLWQSVVDLLLEDPKGDLTDLSIVFAGGIHDAVSSSMVAALASPLVDRGARIGVLMGTAYLFTQEAVSSGALTEEFQKQALACRRTRLLESGIGHATRCADTPFADEFEATRRRLLESGAATEAIRTELELLNVGRLRLASKGVVRRSPPSLEGKSELVAADLAEQRTAGLYMIGDVALLRDETTTVAELHQEVSVRPEALLRETVARGSPWPSEVKRGSLVEEDIAIIGMAGLLPKAEDVQDFWRNIVEGVNAIVEIPKDRWDSEMYYDPDRMARDRVYSRWGGFIGPIRFNPMQWGIPPKSLDSIEPAQLYALEIAARCLKDAGYEKREFDRERTGVLAAVAGPHELFIKYSYRTMSPQILAGIDAFSQDQREEIVGILEEALPEWTEDSFPGFLPNVLSGRIANRLNLCGPNFTVDAACGGSFAALQTAVNQLRLGEVDLMLVGAVDLSNNPLGYMSFSKTQALSPGGQSRPYEDSSDGIGLGEAVLTVMLKRRSDAERDGDHIYAVIKGVGSSSDGGGRSLTAPAAAGQALALRRAYADAGFSPSTVRLIEGHGTGTSLGDRTEVDALVQVFGAAGTAPRSVALGSVKSMIGHTKTAAGLAGLIKSALALGRKVLPPTLGVETPNRSVDFLNGPFYLNTETRPWFADEDHPRRAGISAFGFGGTNFHVVLEEYPDALHEGHDPDMRPSPVELFVWHAGSHEEMQGKLQHILDALGEDSRGNLRELAHAVWKEESRRGVAGKGDMRGASASRCSVLAGSIPELRDRIARALRHLEGDKEFVQDPVGVYVCRGQAISPRQIGFLYPGQGSQKLQMLRDLVVAFPWSQDWFSTANHLARKELGGTLTDFIFPPPALGILDPDELARALDDTRVAQPALEAVGVFATELLARFGLRPGATGGHSFGEYVALWAAGCIESNDLTELAAFRGRISAEASEATPGAMAAVRADPDVTREAMASHGIDGYIANINGPKQTVVAGTVEVIEQAPGSLQG